MRVLHLSTYDIKGGAARSAYRLHGGMLAAGIDSRMLVRSKLGQDPSVEAFSNGDSILSRLYRYVMCVSIATRAQRQAKQAPAGFDPFSVDRTRELIGCDRSADIINLHWVAGFVDPSSFFRQNRNVPVVWRFSDLNPISGGCHYDAGCGKYLTSCAKCPQLGSSTSPDIASEIWSRKKKAFERIPEGCLHLVAQSSWMAEQMRLSPLAGRFPVTVIANGVDTDVYHPTPRPGLRSSLGIADDDGVILFIANSTRTRRKGLSLLMDALSRIDDDVCLLSVGGNEPSGQIRHRHIWLGKMDSDTLLSAVYNAADIFAIPSLQDNLPNTAIEALACGTPVVGFDSGGIRDIVENGLTGRLVPTGDAGALSDAISSLMRDRQVLQSMRTACRESAVQKFHLATQVGLFKDLYSHILAGRKEATNAV